MDEWIFPLELFANFGFDSIWLGVSPDVHSRAPGAFFSVGFFWVGGDPQVGTARRLERCLEHEQGVRKQLNWSQHLGLKPIAAMLLENKIANHRSVAGLDPEMSEEVVSVNVLLRGWVNDFDLNGLRNIEPFVLSAKKFVFLLNRFSTYPVPMPCNRMISMS